jgi:hypothetical protein
LTIGVQFFLDHITGPEDLLFILIHERNHLILRRLYPDVVPGGDYPREVFNFAEDAYVNAIGRRQVASTLPERFYHQPGELLLTAKHSQIDWTLFAIGGDGILSEFRHWVRLFEPGALKGIEGVIQGVLADRATEKTLEGYSIPVPPAITRKDLFSLAGGVIPAVWERRWGVERPHIDLYIDVSGSMGHYYGYIPYIYDALRAVRGRVFQFSTRVVEADPEDPFLHTTGGTRFDAVAQHLLGERSQAAIILSDGHGILANRYIDALRAQLETLVYIKVQENRQQNWELAATEVVILTWSDDPEG